MMSGRIAVPFVLMTILTAIAAGQVSDDVVFLKDGSRLVGKIETIVPEKSVTLRATDGTIYVLEWSRIERIEKGQHSPEEQRHQIRQGLESWYAYLGFGYALTSYQDGTKRYIDQNIKPYSPAHVALAFDFLGFYWPIADDKTLIGLVIDASGDRYTYETGVLGSSSIQFSQYIFGASAMHFFGEIPGDGAFVRGELGPATMSSDLGSNSGIGIQVSGGYGIVISDETRMLVQTGYAFRRLDNGNCNTWSLTIGLLL